MAGTRFVKNDLVREVGMNFTHKIDKLMEELAEEESLTLSDKIREWREQKTRRLIEFTKRVTDGKVEDGELSHFEIKSMPYRDQWQVRHLRDQIEAAVKARDKAIAYIRALAPVEANASKSYEVVEVSAADLKRIGYGL